MAKDVHVRERGGSWVVSKEGSGSVDAYETKQAAVRAGREMARNARSEQVIYSKDGRIEERNTYARDPFPPRRRGLTERLRARLR